MIDEQTDQAHRLVADILAHDFLGVSAVVAFVEQQVERAVHRGQPWREVVGGQLEEALRLGQHLLPACNPLLHRRLGDEERARNFCDREAALWRGRSLAWQGGSARHGGQPGLHIRPYPT